MLFTVENGLTRVGSCIIRRFLSTVVSNDYKGIDIVNNKSENNDDSVVSFNMKRKKSLKIAILGEPNVGKSTLINNLINRSVCPMSSKVHTTKFKSNAIYVEEDTQLVFVDTPGLVTAGEYKKYALNKSFKDDPTMSVQVADVVGIVHDASNVYRRFTIKNNVLELVKNLTPEIPLLLILNKVDMVKEKKILLDITTALINKKDMPKFKDIFMLSALTKDGTEDLKNYLLDLAKSKEWEYDEDIYTDQSPESIIRHTVRAKLLDALPHDLPYKLKVELEHFEICPDGTVSAIVIIACPKERYRKLLVRGKGNRIKNIARFAEEELRHAFRCNVLLRLSVQHIANI